MAGISHEIRNPVNAIIGIAHLLKNESDREVQEDLVNTLIQASENLRELTSNILDFTKLQAGRVPRKLSAVNLRKDLTAGLFSFATVARAKGVDFIIDIWEDVPEHIVIDKVRGMQIILNLVSNAVKFTEKGSVTVEIKALELNGEQATIFFAVRDTGIGIPEDKRMSIFEPFHQGGANISMKHGGSGLGLSIASMLVAGAGGELKLKSRVGKGSEFSFVLRVGIPEDGEICCEEENYSPEELLAGRKVLIVDDNAVNLLVASRTFEKWKIGHAIARHGEEALDRVQEEDFAVVLMDLHMPVMDGYQATRAIRNLGDEKFRRLPIIALSGSVGYAMEEEHSTGFTDFLGKPYKPQDLLDKVLKQVVEIS